MNHNDAQRLACDSRFCVFENDFISLLPNSKQKQKSVWKSGKKNSFDSLTFEVYFEVLD